MLDVDPDSRTAMLTQHLDDLVEDSSRHLTHAAVAKARAAMEMVT